MRSDDRGAQVTQRITFVLRYAEPTLGMETVAIRLMRRLTSSAEVEAIILRGTAEGLADSSVRLRAHTSRSPWQLGRILARRDRSYVVVGIWLGFWMVPLLILLGRRRNLVVWEHSASREKVASARNLRFLVRVARYSYRFAPVVVVPSEALRTDVIECLGVRPDRCVVIPNLLDSSPLAMPTSSVANPDSTVRVSLLTVGSLTATKAQGDILHALSFLPHRYHLTVIGDGPERTNLEDSARHLGVSGRVRFLGPRPPELVLAEMGRADILVHAAHGETFGLVYFEAATCGLPVLSREHSVSKSLIPQVIPGRTYTGGPAALADAIAKYVRPSREEWESAARARVALTDPGLIIEKWLGVIQDHNASVLRKNFGGEPAESEG